MNENGKLTIAAYGTTARFEQEFSSRFTSPKVLGTLVISSRSTATHNAVDLE